MGERETARALSKTLGYEVVVVKGRPDGKGFVYRLPPPPFPPGIVNVQRPHELPAKK